MKCSNHPQADASAICMHCGAALCAGCADKTPTRRTVCSPGCAQALADNEAALAVIRRKTLGGHRLTGYFCCGAAAVLGVIALLAGLDRQWDLFALQFSLAIGAGVSGFFYLRLAGRDETD